MANTVNPVMEHAAYRLAALALTQAAAQVVTQSNTWTCPHTCRTRIGIADGMSLALGVEDVAGYSF